MFSVSVPWALVVAEATVLVAASGGMTTSDDGTGIALAAFVEEPGKLVPLVVVALVAPGRVRRLAAVDWALLGYAAGAGFTVAEDGARRLMPQGVLASLPNDGGLEYSLNAWTAGSFRMWDSDSLLGRLNDDLGPSPL
ncbi:protease PrsW, partial [Actinomyces sp. CCUG 33915]